MTAPSEVPYRKAEEDGAQKNTLAKFGKKCCYGCGRCLKASGSGLRKCWEKLSPESKRKVKLAVGGFCGVLVMLFAAIWLLQGIIYFGVTSMSGCSASALEGYSFPGGGTSNLGGASVNLLPRISTLAEREDNDLFMSRVFDVVPTNDEGEPSGGTSGVWYRTWGPIFPVYTYQDIANSKVTLYMRRKIWQGTTHVIGRCDGQGELVTFTEGAVGHVMNLLRSAMEGNHDETNF